MSKAKQHQEQLAAEAYIKRMLDVTVPLIRIDDSQPSSGGSGFILGREDRFTLITALHNFRSESNQLGTPDFQRWFIETRLVVDNQAVLITLPTANFVVEVDLRLNAGSARHVDFVWGDIDVLALKRQRESEAKLRGKLIDFPIYRGSIGAADSNHVYGFASYSQREMLKNRPELYRFPVYELYMIFDGVNERGLYRFKLNGPHKGHEAYYGASGAPIADEEGKIVAIVQGGNDEEAVIFGVPLHLYIGAMQIPTFGT